MPEQQGMKGTVGSGGGGSPAVLCGRWNASCLIVSVSARTRSFLSPNVAITGSPAEEELWAAC